MEVRQVKTKPYLEWNRIKCQSCPWTGLELFFLDHLKGTHGKVWAQLQTPVENLKD